MHFGWFGFHRLLAGTNPVIDKLNKLGQNRCIVD